MRTDGHRILPAVKVLHVIPSLSLLQGGPSFALPLIAKSLARVGVTVDVATTDDDGPGGRLKVPLGERVERDGCGVFYFRKQVEFYKASWPFRQWIASHVGSYDIVHVHALFSYTSNCAARVAARHGVPCIVRPLGVLNRWGMQNRRRLLKSLSFRFIEQPILRTAAALHYTSRAERVEAEQSGAPPERGVVIPLGIDTGEFANLPGPGLFLKSVPQAVGRTVVLFLSRLDVKKGFDLLLPAFATIKRRHPEAMLVVAGSGDGLYVQELKAEAVRLGIADDVVWPGFLDGEKKLAAFAAATVYVLPSHSENFGIALVEAMSAGLPCVTTDGVAVAEDIRAHEAGLVVPPAIEPLDQGLDRLLKDAPLRSRLGANARRLVGERFSLDAMGAALRALYEAVLNPQDRDVRAVRSFGDAGAAVPARLPILEKAVSTPVRFKQWPCLSS